MGKTTFFRENPLSLQFFLRGTMLHSTLCMIAVVTQFLSISLFSQMQTPGVDLSFSSLFPTLWLSGFKLDLVSWHFRKCYLDLLFSFGLQLLFQTSCLPSELVSNGSVQTTAPTLMFPVLISHSDFTTSAPALTLHHSAFVSSCLIISDVPLTFFSLPRYLLTWS